MNILFISNYFPPEVNAPATRLHEHARHWARDGHSVQVLTSVPNFPEGRVYDGYRNRYSMEETEGARVMRVPVYVAENKGTLRRTLSYLSFMLSAVWYSRRITQLPDVIVATSPQFFAAVAGYVVASMMRRPYVLEIRDLWPESVIAVGAMKRNFLIRMFERLERYLYERADHIVVVTHAFKTFIEEKGISPDKITVLMNGADLAEKPEDLNREKLETLRRQYGLEGKFVASYIGTIGMAHRADIMLEAAQRCTNSDVVFMIVGTGAEREKLESLQLDLKLPNVRLIGKQPKELIPYLLALTDVSIVHLKDSPVFRTVVPSKIFEAMAARIPIVLGVEGETKELILRAGAGITFPPENADQLTHAVLKLLADPSLCRTLADSGFEYVHRCHSRDGLARRYVQVLESTLQRTPAPHTLAVSKLEPVEQI